MDRLTERQKQILAGSLILALGVATGRVSVIEPNDPQRDDKLVHLGSDFGSAVPPPNLPVDVAEYHRAVIAVREGRPDLVDLLTAPIAAGATVTTSVNMPLGTRPVRVDFTGPAERAFGVDCKDCGLTFEDHEDGTTITLTAVNTSPDAMRLTAFVIVTPPPEGR